MKCSVVSCGLCKSKNRPNLTFHRLPKNEFQRRKWLDIIGSENIRSGTKDIHVCSMHFEESAFNKTLNLLRLRDDAVPTIFAKVSALQELKKLEQKVEMQKKKIKCLNKVAREQRLKLSTFKNLIIELKEKNLINMETFILLRQCALQANFKM